MTEDQQKNRRKRRNDILFVSILLAAIALAIAAMLLLRTPGDTVTVTVDGAHFGTYALSENRTVEIPGAGGFNLLVIRDGQALVESASCPDGICAAHRPISFGGQSIICLPNKVVITVQKQAADQPDIIV